MKKIGIYVGCLILTVSTYAQNTTIADKNFYEEKVAKLQMPEKVKKIHASYVEKAKKIQTALREGGTIQAQELKELAELYEEIVRGIYWPYWYVFHYQEHYRTDSITAFTYRSSTMEMLKNTPEYDTVKVVHFDAPGPDTTVVWKNEIFRGGDWTAFEPDFPYYIPLYDRQSGKIVSCLLLCAGIDGAIDNKIGEGEKIYTDEWRKKIKAYNLWETEIRDHPYYFGTFIEDFHENPGKYQKYKDIEMPGGMTMHKFHAFTVEDLIHGGKDLILHLGSNCYVDTDGKATSRLKP